MITFLNEGEYQSPLRLLTNDARERLYNQIGFPPTPTPTPTPPRGGAPVSPQDLIRRPGIWTRLINFVPNQVGNLWNFFLEPFGGDPSHPVLVAFWVSTVVVNMNLLYRAIFQIYPIQRQVNLQGDVINQLQRTTQRMSARLNEVTAEQQNRLLHELTENNVRTPVSLLNSPSSSNNS
jgi:hypothetical protein